jgi:hypothetical protein
VSYLSAEQEATLASRVCIRYICFSTFYMLFDHVIGVLELLAGITGIILAVRSDRKFKTAEQARKRVERRFKQYMASQEFQKLATDGLALMQDITTAAWQSATTAASRIGADLLKARGAYAPLMTPIEQDRLDVAAAEFQQFILSLPQAGQPQPTVGQTQDMISRCLAVAHTASELGGRLGVESMSEPEEKK